MSWIDLTDTEPEENSQILNNNFEDPPEHKETNSEEAQLVSTITEEISRLFDIPRDQIPLNQDNSEFLLDLPYLSPDIQETTVQEPFSFLDYLNDQNLI